LLEESNFSKENILSQIKDKEDIITKFKGELSLIREQLENTEKEKVKVKYKIRML